MPLKRRSACRDLAAHSSSALLAHHPAACRALCMELTRAAQSSRQMQAAVLPMLGGVEARLVQVLGLKARPAALVSGGGAGAAPGQA